MADRAPPALERGLCTLIVARTGPVERESDLRLLEAVEREAGLPANSLHRTASMDAREFRLVEGVSRPVADRVANVARELGYAPRVRDRLGIKWSSERGAEMGLWFAAVWMAFGLIWALGFPLIDAWLGPPARLPAMLLTVPAMVFGIGALYRWQLQKLYMPLVTSPLSLPEPIAVRAGELAEVAHEALDGLGRVSRALENGALPGFAAQDLEVGIDVVRRTVRQQVREAEALDRRSREVMASLQARMAALDSASEDVIASLSNEIERAEAEEARRSEARLALAEELAQIHRLAEEAYEALQGDDPDLAPLERLRQLGAGEAPITKAAEAKPQGVQRALQARAVKS